MPTTNGESGRTIVVGDVHGCRAELDDLLALVSFSKSDALYFLGDLLSRGPDPEGVLALLRRTGAKSVRGNHDDVLIRWHEAGSQATLKGSQIAEG